MNYVSLLRFALALVAVTTASSAAEQVSELKSPSVSGSIEDGKARLIIEGWLGGQPSPDTGVFAARLEHLIQISPDLATQKITGTIDILEGTPSEVTLTVSGEGDIREVTGESWLRDWSIRQETSGTRTLVLRLHKRESSEKKLSFSIAAIRDFQQPPSVYTPLALVPPVPALLSGVVAIRPDPAFRAEAVNASGVIPIEPKLLPDTLKDPNSAEEEVLAYRFQGTEYLLALQLSPADPETRQVVLRNFKLNGRLNDQEAAFKLIATAVVKHSKGGRSVWSPVSGADALCAAAGLPLETRGDCYVLVFERAGDFPIELEFNAAMELGAEGLKGWKTVQFGVAPASIQPLTLDGLNADTQFEFANAARPERSGSGFVSFLPADGKVRLSWKESPPETEGKLFYAAEMLSQVTVSPGLMRQFALLNFKVMQGEMTEIAFNVSGEGEITRVQGDHLLSWSVQPGADASERQLLVRLNQPVKDHFDLQVQMQTPLASFPVSMSALRLRPNSATRLAGYFRVVNEGAVRLEVPDSQGLLQVSPEQFPESDLTRAVLAPTGSQRFAFRFSGPDFSLRLNADQILPEVMVSRS
jgi:hypothetical protein